MEIKFLETVCVLNISSICTISTCEEFADFKGSDTWKLIWNELKNKRWSCQERPCRLDNLNTIFYNEVFYWNIY